MFWFIVLEYSGMDHLFQFLGHLILFFPNAWAERAFVGSWLCASLNLEPENLGSMPISSRDRGLASSKLLLFSEPQIPHLKWKIFSLPPRAVSETSVSFMSPQDTSWTLERLSLGFEGL